MQQLNSHVCSLQYERCYHKSCVNCRASSAAAATFVASPLTSHGRNQADLWHSAPFPSHRKYFSKVFRLFVTCRPRPTALTGLNLTYGITLTLIPRALQLEFLIVGTRKLPSYGYSAIKLVYKWTFLNIRP